MDDRLNIPLPGDADATLQLGLRADVLHGGGSWFSTVRDVVVQPRANLELAPLPWLRLHAGAGRFSKSPTIGQLSPAPQWFDVVNVNWYADDPAERLAVLDLRDRGEISDDALRAVERDLDLDELRREA